MAFHPQQAVKGESGVAGVTHDGEFMVDGGSVAYRLWKNTHSRVLVVHFHANAETVW